VSGPVLLAALAPLFPLAAFLIILSLARRTPRLAAGVSLSAVSASLVLALLVLLSQIAAPGRLEGEIVWLAIGGVRLGAGVLVDPLSSLMLVVVSSVSLLVQLYAVGYMRGDPGYPRFFAFLSLFSASMLALVAANSLVLLYMAWELVGLCSYLLIGFWYERPQAAAAAKKAFVVTRLGDLGFLIGIILLGTLAGSFNYGEAERAMQAFAPGQVTLVAMLLFCGAMGKSGQFPLHVWLPDAMEGPTPVSALLHSATMVVAGVFLVGRLYPIFQASEAASTLIAFLGAFTAAFAAAIALVQKDIKRVLAYSTLSQIGYMMLSLGIGGYTPAFFHLTTHAAFKTFLFMCAGSVIHAVGTNDIWKMGGLARRMPVTAIFFGIGTLAIAGIFPFSGFWSKDEILESILHSGHPGLYAVALVTVFLTAFYMARVFFLVFTGKPRGEQRAHAFESPGIMNVPLVILAALSVALGVIVLPWLPWNFHAFLRVGQQVFSRELDVPVMVLSDVIGLGGILAAFLIYVKRVVSPEALRRAAGPLYTLLAKGFYVDELYGLLVHGLFLAAARGLAWFDRAVVDGAVNLVGVSARRAGDLIRRTLTGKVQGYALLAFGGLAAALLALLLLGLGGGR
jgi:NADH-quinone oxidoreductase subunit L